MGADHRCVLWHRQGFARQIAASGIHVALVARRESLLRTVGAECTEAFGVEHRIIALDLSEPGFLPILADATRDLDVGLVAGSMPNFLSTGVSVGAGGSTVT